MTCKNCDSNIDENNSFCASCGARIIRDRITIKNLTKDIFQNAFGWDSKFLLTLRMLFTGPKVLLKEYIGGTRKKYMNPFTFLGIGSAIAIFIFNFFSEDYLTLNVESNKQTAEVLSDFLSKQKGEGFDAIEFKKEYMESIENTSSFMLKYFNLLVLFFMPFYTFMAKLVYGRPYNYAEHLVINSYIQGITFWVTTMMFVVSVFTNPSVYFITVFFTVLYYLYVYGKLYELSIAESILKFLKFLGLSVLFFILLFLVSFLFGLLFR